MTTTWSNHWVRSCLVVKSESTSNFESEKIIQFWEIYCCAPSLQSCPLILISVDPNPRDQALISRSVVFFLQKSSVMFVVLRWTINSLERKCTYNGNVLTKKTKMPFLLDSGCFLAKLLGHRRFLGRVALSLQKLYCLIQHYNHTWVFLEKRSTGWYTGAFLRVFLGKINKNGLF